MSLSQEQIESYARDGYLPAIDVVGAEQATDYRRQFDELEAEVGREKAGIGLIDLHFQRRFIWDIAVNPVVLDAIEALLGPNILLLASHFFCKYGPDKEKFVAWHQDVTFWGLEPPKAITAWFAVDDSDAGNGCMQVIPATQLGGILQHGKADQAGNLLSINQEVMISDEQRQGAVDLPLRAGQMSLHSGTLIHGSLSNMSTRRRCGLTLRYVPTSVRQTKDNSHGGSWNALLVRGEDREQNFGLRTIPFA